MNRRSLTILAVLVLTVYAAYSLVAVQPQTRKLAVSSQHPASSAASERVFTAPEPELVRSGLSLRAAAVRNAVDYRSALQELSARSLDWDIARVTAHQEVRSACALVHQPDSASPRVDMDPNRRPWLDRLQQRCAGLPPDALAPLPYDDPAQQAWIAQVPELVAAQHGRSAALRHSDELLRHSVDTRLLHEALRYALVEGQLPLEQIFTGASPPVNADVELALVNAADWIGCERSGSCGTQGLWTLYTCAQFGCPAGSDLPTALQRITPPWQYEITRAIAMWALRGR